MKFINLKLKWSETYIEAKTDYGVYSLLADGRTVLTNIEETEVIETLCKAKKEFSQNDFCGTYDQNQLFKSICQFHHLKKQNDLPSDLMLDFFDFNNKEKIKYYKELYELQYSITVGGFGSSDYSCAITKFGTYFLDYSGRVLFHPHKDYYNNISSKRLIHIPNSNDTYKTKSIYNAEDLKMALCQMNHLELLIKEEEGIIKAKGHGLF